jgi:hypothetical protein
MATCLQVQRQYRTARASSRARPLDLPGASSSTKKEQMKDNKLSTFADRLKAKLSGSDASIDPTASARGM